MSHNAADKNQKPIYKKWWGIILLVLVWPITVGWLIWKKTDWPQGGKIAATAALVIFVLIMKPDSSEQKTQVDTAPATNSVQEQQVPKVERTLAAEEPQAEEAEVKEAVASVTPEPEKTLNISYNDVMNYLSNFFTMEQSSDVRGKKRWMGQTANNLAILEIIGEKNNISSTSLMIGVPGDNQQVIVQNSAILLRFIKNTFPGWPGGSDWATSALEKATQSPNKAIKTVYNNKEISITSSPELSMVITTVSSAQ